MKIEICENTFWLSFWAVIVAGLVAITWVLGSQYTKRTEAAFAAGYVETLGQSQITHWTK